MDEQVQIANQDIEVLSQQEMQRVNAAKEIFIQDGNPYPERRIVNFWDIVGIFGIEIVLRILSTTGAALVSATAVGAVMEITVVKMLQVFSAQTDAVNTYGIFYWSMLAFEGGLMASGMTAGRKNGTLKNSSWATVAGFAVTVTAGLLRSLTLLNNPGMEFILAIIFGLVVGVAGPVISYYGSENFGYILKEIQKLQSVFDKEWKSRIQEWGTQFKHAYPRIAKQVFGQDRRLGVRYEDDEHKNGSNPEPKPQEPKKNLRALVKGYLKENAISPSQVGDKAKGGLMEPSEIADSLSLIGSDRDAVRTYMGQFRKEEKEGKW